MDARTYDINQADLNNFKAILKETIGHNLETLAWSVQEGCFTAAMNRAQKQAIEEAFPALDPQLAIKAVTYDMYELNIPTACLSLFYLNQFPNEMKNEVLKNLTYTELGDVRLASKTTRNLVTCSLFAAKKKEIPQIIQDATTYIAKHSEELFGPGVFFGSVEKSGPTDTITFYLEEFSKEFPGYVESVVALYTLKELEEFARLARAEAKNTHTETAQDVTKQQKTGFRQ